MVDLTNCTFDGHIYNTRRVMEECLAIKPDLIFLWDEAWFGFARLSPFLRPRTAMGAASDIEAWMHDPESVEATRSSRPSSATNPSNEMLLATRLIPDPRKVRLRVYQTNSTHKSMSALRQGSMLLVKDVDFHTVEAQFHEAVFTHASTSPNQQLIASLDVARRQMELEGYGLVANAIEIALAIRQAVNAHPLISKYFQHARRRQDGAGASTARAASPTSWRRGTNWAVARQSMHEDEFCLDPTRMTLVCGTAGFDGTQFKGCWPTGTTSRSTRPRATPCCSSPTSTTPAATSPSYPRAGRDRGEIDQRLAQGGANGRKAFAARVKSLMTDVPDLPNFCHFHEASAAMPASETNEGDMRSGFYRAYDARGLRIHPLARSGDRPAPEERPGLVSANFVIPYPPGFPIMVPGQVITQETIDFMRKLDVKEIHGYDAAEGSEAGPPRGAGEARRSPNRAGMGSAAAE